MWRTITIVMVFLWNFQNCLTQFRSLVLTFPYLNSTLPHSLTKNCNCVEIIQLLKIINLSTFSFIYEPFKSIFILAHISPIFFFIENYDHTHEFMKCFMIKLQWIFNKHKSTNKNFVKGKHYLNFSWALLYAGGELKQQKLG